MTDQMDYAGLLKEAMLLVAQMQENRRLFRYEFNVRRGKVKEVTD